MVKKSTSGEGRPNQCIHIKRDGTRCKRAAQTGLERCSTPGHGGTAPSQKAKAAAARQMVIVERRYGGASVDESHEGANPVTGLGWELRRTAGKIIAVEERIAELRHYDIVWGRAYEERKDGEPTFGPSGQQSGDTSYDLTRDEAAINLWVQLGLKERQHYAQLCKIAIAAGFEDRRIRLLEDQVLQINDAIGNVISALGHNPDDPAIRAVVRDNLLALLPAS